MAILKQLAKSVHGVCLNALYLFIFFPWLCGGDFNDISKAEEKRGGQLKNTESYV